MGDNLFISELLLAVIATIDLLIFWQFVRSKNGVLRKIFIFLFLVDAYVYIFSMIYWYRVESSMTVMTVEVFRMLVLIPKAIVMLVLLRYLIKQKTN
jgi:hypothetical protein